MDLRLLHISYIKEPLQYFLDYFIHSQLRCPVRSAQTNDIRMLMTSSGAVFFFLEEKQDSSLPLNQICHGKRRILHSAILVVITSLSLPRFCCFSPQVGKIAAIMFSPTGGRPKTG